MSFISKLTPINLEEEKEKFFKLNFNYNPQFSYSQSIEPRQLAKYGKPDPKLVKLAEKIVKTAYQDKNHQELKKLEGEILAQKQILDLVEKFLKLHQLDRRYKVMIDPTIIPRATVTSHLVKLKPNISFSREGLLSLLYHEIGTHILRRVNYEKQPWYKKRKKYGLTHPYLVTEEGLAVLHGLLPRSNKLVYRSALKYLAVAKANQLSFKTLFAWVNQYLQKPSHAWSFSLRIKRGLKDTSQPGGFTKDLVYFGGFVKVWRWLKEHDFKVDDLYCGKLAVEDVKTAKKLNPKYQPILPSFYLADKEQYREQMVEIGRANFLN